MRRHGASIKRWNSTEPPFGLRQDRQLETALFSPGVPYTARLREKTDWMTGSASSIRVALMETSFSVMASFDILRWLQNLIRQNETSRGRQPKYIENGDSMLLRWMASFWRHNVRHLCLSLTTGGPIGRCHETSSISVRRKWKGEKTRDKKGETRIKMVGEEEKESKKRPKKCRRK